MGRFETLKPETQDMIKAMLPAIATSYEIDFENFVDIIPEDIRMRMWDCERRDHIKNQPENDPRNWGVEFLKLLAAVARLNGNNLALLQERLREKVAKHSEKHPWVRLDDLRLVKAEFQNPALRNPELPQPESSSEDSMDSYLEELVDQDVPQGTKRGNHEAYVSRVQGWWKANLPKKPKKPVRLRRSEGGGYERRGKGKNKRKSMETSPSPEASDQSDSADSASEKDTKNTKRRRLTKRRPTAREGSLTILDSGDSDEDLEAKAALAELEAAEAELEVKRKKQRALQAKLKAKQAKTTRPGSASSASVPAKTSSLNPAGFKGFNILGDGGEEASDDDNGLGFNVAGFSDRTSFRGFAQAKGSTSVGGRSKNKDSSNSNKSPSPSAGPSKSIHLSSTSPPPTDEEGWREESSEHGSGDEEGSGDESDSDDDSSE